MLARFFKTAEELNLKQKHYDALMLCLHALERGEVPHLGVNADLYPVDSRGPLRPFGFNMDTWCLRTSCGTVGCIGGTAEVLGKLKRAELAAKTTDKDLNDLFYPSFLVDWRDITVEQAAQALSNYLTTGKANWRQVMGQKA